MDEVTLVFNHYDSFDSRYNGINVTTELESRRNHHLKCVLNGTLPSYIGSNQMIPAITGFYRSSASLFPKS